MRIIPFLSLFALLFLCCWFSFEWNLPLRLDEEDVSVYGKLGIPDERIDAKTMLTRGEEAAKAWASANPGMSIEYFYGKGLVVRFKEGRAFGITAVSYSNHSGFHRYRGNFINGFSFDDTRESLLKKMGSPFRMEHLGRSKTPSDSASIFPDETRYEWNKKGYWVTVFVRDQAQILDLDKKEIANPNTISLVTLEKR